MGSENGWEPARVGQDALTWVTVPGSEVRLQLMSGWPAKVLAAFAGDYNAYVEPLRDRDSASWTPTNSVPTSNHLNGTAMDLNWDSHPFKVRGTFSTPQMTTIRELLAFYEKTVFWAGDWQSPIDEMHWQMGYGTYNNPTVGDVIKRKIRPDGFSTFRRGGAVVPPTSPGALVALTVAEQRELLELARRQSGYRRPSRSPLRRVGEGDVDTIAGLAWNTDGSVHVLLINLLARLGDPDALNLLAEVAGLDTSVYPDRAHDKRLARAILNVVAGQAPVGSAPAIGAVPGVVYPETSPPAPFTPTAPVAPAGGGVQSHISGMGAALDDLNSALSTLVNKIGS